MIQKTLIIIIVLIFSLSAQLPKAAFTGLSSKSVPSADLEALNAKLSIELHQSGFFDLLERQKLDQIFKEQALSQSGAIDDKLAVRIGSIAGCESIITGSLEKSDRFYILVLKTVSVETGRVEHTISIEHGGKFKGLLDNGAKQAVKKLTWDNPALKPIEVEFTFIAVHDGKSRKVASGDTLRTGDRLHVKVRPNQRCFIYVINQDASGAIYSLFPNPSQRYKALNASQTYEIPGAGSSFELDNTVGTEHIFITASATLLEDIENLLFKDNDSVLEREKVVSSMRTRGFARIVQGNETVVTLENGVNYKGVSDLLSGKGSFRHEVTFVHIH